MTTTLEKDVWIKDHFGLESDTQTASVNMTVAATIQTEFHIQNAQGHLMTFELIEMMDGATKVKMSQGFSRPLLSTHPFNAEEARNIWRDKIASGYVRVK